MKPVSIQFPMWLLLLFFSISTEAQNNGISRCDTIVLSSNNEIEYDASLYSGDPNNSFPLDENFIAETWTISGNTITLRAAFKIPLPTLPIGSIIDSAVFFLQYNNTTTHSQGNSYYPGSPYADVNDGGMYRIIQNWDPSTVTWTNQPGTTNLNFVWVPPSSSKTQNLRVNITPLVNDAYAYPNNSFGFMFKMITEMVYRCQVYASSNHPNPALRPKLVLCYTTKTTGVSDYTHGHNLRVFDNKNGELTMANPEAILLDHVQLFSIDGKLLETLPIHNSQKQQTIAFQKAMPSGLYFICIQTAKGMHTQKLSF